MARRQHLTVTIVLAVVVFFSLTWLMSSSSSAGASFSAANFQFDSTDSLKKQSNFGSDSLAGIPNGVLTGGAIAPKLGNETAKRELGRATWKLMHTMMARFPEKPTEDDQLALKTWVTLFARLYPCGECAAHFQKFLAKYPVQTSSRNAAAGWACFMHNVVNDRLKKPMFDCSKIGDFYDCGCGEEGKDGQKAAPAAGEGELKGREPVPPANLKIEKEEGLARGG